MKKNLICILAAILIISVCSCTDGSEEVFMTDFSEMDTDSGIDINGYE